MNTARKIPQSVTDNQARASDPEVSAWVAANAGSGKTHVLVQRVIRLLLSGVEPSKILCITFTKAAAANMAMRVFNELARWTALSDEELDSAIAATGARAGADARPVARRLFAQALETPGGLKVQTIHAFCTRLLHQFPFEAEVAARFAVLDESTESELLDELSLRAMLEGAAQPQSTLGRALGTAANLAADQTFREMVREAIRLRAKVAHWVSRTGSVDKAIGELCGVLGVSPADTRESVNAEILAKSPIKAADWAAVAQAMQVGSDADIERGAAMTALASLGEAERLGGYIGFFCTQKLTPRKSLATKKVVDAHPALFQRLAEECERVMTLIKRRNAVACRERTWALLVIATAVLDRYRAEKDRRGLLDYEDLIEKTLALLDRDDAAAWVLYKLDAGIDHVLIDEAQDTSPQQWRIVEKLIGEFTAGEGARKVHRTLFAVGDDKQSIFSFQGADPAKFGAMKTEFSRAFEAAQLPFIDVHLQTSFRAGRDLLGAVDLVFGQPNAHQGLTADPVRTVHDALQDAPAGCVDIWEIEEADEKPEPDVWAPFDALSETSAQVKLARRIARHVKASIGQEPVRIDAKPASERDVLILVRQRGPLFEAIIRALKDAEIPVAGADRLILIEHIAVMDLLALADALLLERDDLALACALKSPLFGLSENDLFDIAWNRGNKTLRESLIAHGKFGGVAETIKKLGKAAREESPFTFYSRLLGPGGGRKRFLARLGAEANDALDEFLNLALAYESRQTPSLQGFVAWLREAQTEVKRDMEIARDEVRVMTVHGAKGLEAPIVILADTTTPPAGPRPPRFFPLSAESDEMAALVWAGKKDDDTDPVAAGRARAVQIAEHEYLRLLYVGMTRAADRLVVCGFKGANKLPDNCWYDLVAAVLKTDQAAVTLPGGETIWRHGNARSAAEVRDKKDVGKAAATPAWLSAEVRKDAPRAVKVTPSGPAEDDFAVRGALAATAREIALARGRAVHRLFQSLPDIAPEQREAAARSYVSRLRDNIDDAERRAIVSQVLAVLSDAKFSPLFARGSRAEVPIVGTLARERRPSLAITGQVDRLAVMEHEVLIADYKTNRPAPASLEEAIRDYPDYVRQLACYRAVLRRIYPDRAVRAALVWTDRPALMEIPAAMLEAAFTPA